MLIGMYCADSIIEKLLKQERTYYMAAEAFMQGAKLLVFSVKDVDFNNKTVTSYTRENNSWVRVTTPFPDVMINAYTDLKEGLKEEFMLRAEIPFTSHFLSAKKTFFHQIKEAGQFDSLLIPYASVKSIGAIDEYLTKYKKIIVKPSIGARGLGIYQISGTFDRYILRDNKKTHKLDRHNLKKIVDDFIDKGYLVQPYMECRTSMDEPFDFRIHIQKDGQGAWQITRMYARIGAKGSVLSNISQGGLSCDIDYFLKVEYGERASYWKDKLETLSFDIAKHIEEIYMQSFDEFGIDLAIDKDENIWLYEVNSGPQTKYHEPQRARHIIAYARYIAKNYKGNNKEILVSLANRITDGLESIRDDLAVKVDETIKVKLLVQTMRPMVDTIESFGILEQRLKVGVTAYEQSSIYPLTEAIKGQFGKIVLTYETNDRNEAISLIDNLINDLLPEWIRGINNIFDEA